MRPITEVYADERWGWSDYTPLLESFGYAVVAREDESDCQGDSWVLYADPATGRVGYLQFGWGSCSGCDALQACDTLEQVGVLQQSLHEEIRWFADRAEAAEWFAAHDWEGDYSGGKAECRKFVEGVKELLAAPGCRPEWRTEAVVALARGVAADDAWGRLPVLADALEDAGCDDAATLAALRAGDAAGRLFVMSVLHDAG